MSDKENIYEEKFIKPVISIGRKTLFAAIILGLLPPIYLAVRYGALPKISQILEGWFLIAAIYGTYYFIEPISYYPVLGLSGTYMSFLSGNIGNMRVPCAAVAQDALKTTPGTEKAELVATLGIAGSIVSNLIIVTLTAIFGQYLIKALPATVLEAFDFVLPSVFGAMFAMFAEKHPKYGAFAMGLVLVLLLGFKSVPVWIVIPAAVFGTIALAVYSTKKEYKKSK